MIKAETLHVSADRNIQTTSGGISLGVQFYDGASIGTGGNIGLTAGGDINIAGDFDAEIDGSNDGHITEGGNLSVMIDGGLTATGRISPVIDIDSGGSITTGGNIDFQIGTDLNADSFLPVIDTDSSGTIGTGGNISLNVTGNAQVAQISAVIDNDTFGNIGMGGSITGMVGGNLTSSTVNLDIDNSFGGQIGTGGNISLTVGGNLTTGGGAVDAAGPVLRPGSDVLVPSGSQPDLQLTLQNTNGNIDTGGNITLMVGGKGTGDVHANAFALYLQNYDETANAAGHIGTGGNINVQIGGNLTTDSYLDVFLNNRGGGMIDSGGNLTFNIGGALTVGADETGFSSEFIVGNRYVDSGGNTSGSSIGSNVSVYVHAASVSMDGIIYGCGISNRSSVISGNATVTWDVPGDVTIQGTANIFGSSGAAWFVLNDIPSDYQFTPPSGGTIHGDATVTVNTGGDLSVTGNAAAYIDQFRRSGLPDLNGGTIDGNAAVNITAANISIGDDKTTSNFDVYIGNQRNGPGPGTAGSIGSDATIQLSVANNLSTTGYLDTEIDNYNGGIINGNASVSVSAGMAARGRGGLLTPGISIGSDAIFGIYNFGGGNIDGTATVTVDAADISVGGDLSAEITNSGGTIGDDAEINFNIAGDLVTENSANFFLVNSDGGHIAGNATVNALASGGINGGNGAFFAIINDDSDGKTLGGTIVGDALVHVTADHLSTETLDENDFNLFGTIHNSGGSIGGNSKVMFDISGAITTAGRASFDILNFNDGGENGGGMIGGNATVNVNAGALSIDGELLAKIINNGGTIDGNAAISINALNSGGKKRRASTGNIDILDAATIQILNSGEGSQIGGNASISVTTGGDFHAGSLDALIDNTSGGLVKSASINFNIGGALTTDGDASFVIDGSTPKSSKRPGKEPVPMILVDTGSIDVGGSLTANIRDDGGKFISEGNVSVHADTDIMVGGDLNTWGSVTAGNNISVGGVVYVPTEVTATNGSVSIVGGAFVFEISAGTDVNIGGGADSAFLLVNDLTAGNALNLMDVSLIQPESASSDGSVGFTPDDMTVTVNSIVTTGPTIPFLPSNGSDADSNFGNDNPGNGGKVTLNINAGGLTIGSGGQINYIAANGGNYATDSTAGGGGGTVNINATGDVTLNDGDNETPAITTYTGLIPDGGPFILGDGGAVTINSGGTVTVNSTVIVSSNDVFKAAPDETPPPYRASSNGGNITINSTKTSGQAINVTSSGQLLSLLNGAAPGPGGKILLHATNPKTKRNGRPNGGNNSTIDIDNGNGEPGAIIADRGTVEIRHEGIDGAININNAYIFADIVKIGALGTNGTLTIGGGLISADSQLKLYAGGSNGTIHFIANVTLSSPVNILAADTVHIDMGVTVFIDNPNKTPADVYTNHAEYGIAGTGDFGGAGANTHSLTEAPPFDDTVARAGRHRHRAASQTTAAAPFRQRVVPSIENGTVTPTRIRESVSNSIPRR